MFIYLSIQLFSCLLILLFSIGFLRVLSKKKQKIVPNKNTTPISVIIYTKNHAKELAKLLEQLLTQKSVNFEIIVINHTSFDDTLDIAKSFAGLYKNIKIVDVPENEKFWNNKRFAFTLGVKKATYERLVFIDATTIINSDLWLSTVIQNNEPIKDIIIGSTKPIQVDKKRKGFFRYSYLKTQLYNLSFSKICSPYIMGDQNISYRKSLFFKHNGFINHISSREYTHELFIDLIANKKNTVYTNEQAVLVKIPSKRKDWAKHKKQQRKLFSKLNPSARFIHYLFLTTKIVTLIATILTIYYSILLGLLPYTITTATVFLACVVFHWFAIGKYLFFYNEKKLCWFIPFYELRSFTNLF